MKVIVDEGVPRQVAKALQDQGIEAHRFDAALAGLDNGVLIARIEAAGFDILLTNDKNMANQRSLRGRRVAVVALPLNKKRPLLERAKDIADTIRRAEPGQHIIMEMDGSRSARTAEPGGDVVLEFPSLAPFPSS